MTHARALSSSEFRAAFLAARPPTGWTDRVAVAFSGGPDSTALLGLLHRHIKSGHSSTPSSLVALTVDHGLRPGSAAEAASLHSVCSSMGVDHCVLTVPWSAGPYPRHPPPVQYEEVARRARYHILFSAMVEADIPILLLAHHADDQAETAYMRATRSSGKLGLAGMRRCRRFGMGGPSTDPLGRFGLAGMNMWMSRPLLDFPKERLVATCKELGLPFVTDESNLDPGVSLRNRIRSLLTVSPEAFDAIGDDPVQNVKATSMFLGGALSPSNGVTSVAVHNSKTAVYQMAERARIRDVFDTQVTELLKGMSVESPISTITVSQRPNVHEKEVELGVIARILRYISPRPWGHPSAEAARNDARLREVWRVVFDKQPVTNFDPYASFTVGSEVLWKHVPSGSRFPLWMALRAPPRRGAEIGRLCMDITKPILWARESGRPPATILWDNRFSIDLPAPGLPDDLLTPPFQIMIDAAVKYTLPMVILQAGGQDTVLGAMQPDGTITHDTDKLHVNINWIRSKEAI